MILAQKRLLDITTWSGRTYLHWGQVWRQLHPRRNWKRTSWLLNRRGWKDRGDPFLLSPSIVHSSNISRILKGIKVWASSEERLKFHKEVHAEYEKSKKDENYICSTKFITKSSRLGPAEVALQTPYRAGKFLYVLPKNNKIITHLRCQLGTATQCYGACKEMLLSPSVWRGWCCWWYRRRLGVVEVCFPI